MVVSSHRSFARFSATLLSVSMALFAVVGCGKSSNSGESDLVVQTPVSANSNEITYANYRDHNISIIVPPGNRNPKLTWETLNSAENMPSKTRAGFGLRRGLGSMNATELRAELDVRFNDVLRELSKTPNVVAEMRRAGALYGVDPVLILGNVVGEHVYNLAIKPQDLAGEAAVRTARVGVWTMRFEKNGTLLSTVLREPAFVKCEAKKADSQFAYWECASEVYNTEYVGKFVNGRQYDTTLFRKTFFDPTGAGMTYGLGQLDPIRALMVTDKVHAISGLRLLTIEKPVEIYEDILNPMATVHYVAANIVVSIDAYKRVANFDISQNPGVVATMYNLGNEKKFSTIRYKENLRALQEGREIEMPRESYYGFLINSKEQELRRFVQTGKL